ncbi:MULTISPECIES: aminoacyl-histidine dipeptidase [unclassified Treponema]|uniref:aminoacyl-histidine dipeptidase n=1 Tax=unclassified Treponema TaxID=2638727 RepID=UPI0020A271A3|nr:MULTISPECIES: aminoacyl-histidine dipeptidase [unclassified Treponema]UTC67519.1 aminoacyl-histidine dipeptidase [Treponema sp. OMZ 789]UTC70247.1 aminoacyl-histidine dipeptidase [Treponema sp. OMZ 790]UTC72962.1 aminoacyl-histidine dipeptidase [Treponema sp. OMZ 791]
MNPLQNTEPKEVFKWFYEISQVPRGSGNERAISDFLVKFAKDRNLEVHQDKAMNVIIKKSGTAGYEKSPTVIIQGHMDMVCEKDTSSNHDFLKDPIKFVVKDGMLYADKTTLGGDDGIAVAYALTVLDSKDIPHPPLEVLITTEEETGMGGAMALTDEHLQGTRLLNIDSEEEGVFLVSCAGGANIHVFFDIKKEAANGKFLKITVGGLLGGHSGIEINKQRANSIKLLGRVLYNIKQNEKINIVEISGGSKHNAIAKDAYAVIAVENTDAVLKIVEKTAADFKSEYRAVDKLLSLTAAEAQNPSGQMFTKELTLNIIDFMAGIPNGVQYMSMEIPGLVQTSLNNGVLEAIDGRIKFTTSVRSSVKSALDEIVDVLKILAERCGAEFKKASEYPAWEYSPDSPVRDAAVNVYKKLNGKEPVITAIHAGLECGLLKKTLPNVDAVSFGPNLHDVHTPNEHMEIASVERVWKFLTAYLAELKN